MMVYDLAPPFLSWRSKLPTVMKPAIGWIRGPIVVAIMPKA